MNVQPAVAHGPQSPPLPLNSLLSFRHHHPFVRFSPLKVYCLCPPPIPPNFSTVVNFGLPFPLFHLHPRWVIPPKIVSSQYFRLEAKVGQLEEMTKKCAFTDGGPFPSIVSSFLGKSCCFLFVPKQPTSSHLRAKVNPEPTLNLYLSKNISRMKTGKTNFPERKGAKHIYRKEKKQNTFSGMKWGKTHFPE
jgi:hypothetical protein